VIQTQLLAKSEEGTGGVVQTTELLPSKHKALISNPSTAKKKKKKERREWGSGGGMRSRIKVWSTP
jgi:hypothetical protein